MTKRSKRVFVLGLAVLVTAVAAGALLWGSGLIGTDPDDRSDLPPPPAYDPTKEDGGNEGDGKEDPGGDPGSAVKEDPEAPPPTRCEEYEEEGKTYRDFYSGGELVLRSIAWEEDSYYVFRYGTLEDGKRHGMWNTEYRDREKGPGSRPVRTELTYYWLDEEVTAEEYANRKGDGKGVLDGLFN